MSEQRRHRRRSSSGGKKVLVWLALGLVLGALAANLVVSLIPRKDPDAQGGFITPEIVWGAAFWVPIATATLLALCGLYWSTKAYAHNERTSHLWARRGFVFALFGALGLSIATFEQGVSRIWIAAIASVVFGGQTVFLAMYSFKEYRRAETGEDTRHPRQRSLLESPSAPAPSAEPPAPAGSADVPGPTA